MPQITVCDRASFAVSQSKRIYTDEGFLRVPGRVARTGTQEYLARELGLTDRAPNDIIKVHRPEESVFDADSLASYDGADVTIEHPSGLVNAETYKHVSVGTVRGAGTRDGDFVTAELIIKDAAGVKAVESGKVQLSAGYTAIYDEAPEGSPYDFIQRDIKINHVALVDTARAGAQARLFDHNPGVHNMPVMITLDSGRQIDAADPANATLVAETIDKLRTSLDASMKEEEKQRAKASEAEEKADMANAKADETEEELEKERAKTTDAAIAERIKAITVVMDGARKLAGDEFTCDSCDPVTIMRTALTVAKDGIDWDDKTPAYVQGRFDAAVEALDGAPAANAEQLARLAADAATVVAKQQEAPKLSSYDSFKQSQADAWKPKEA